MENGNQHMALKADGSSLGQLLNSVHWRGALEKVVKYEEATSAGTCVCRACVARTALSAVKTFSCFASHFFPEYFPQCVIEKH